MTKPGVGGRPTKPTNLKLVDGDRADRINVDEPIPGEGTVLPPAWLVELDGKSPADGRQTALEVWRVLAPDLIAKGVLTAWDVEAFAVWCDAVVQHRRAALQVTEEGLVIEGQRGPIKNPACQLVRDYSDTMTKFGARFGLTPSDRAGLKIEKGSSGGGAERFLS